jgi:DNA topoisomerase III
MSKSLVLAEKPSVARDIARVLGCNKKGNGFLEGTQYIVTWALGHLVTHADPEGYGNEFKEWKLEHLPIIPDPFKLVPIRQTTRQFNAVKSQLRRNDVSDVIIATDAGREGELVARWILEQKKCRKPVKRLWISSVTDKAIKDGFNNLKPGRAYENLYEAAVARAEADWVVGINATRALTVKHNAQLSTGRVQTPTLAMIAEREKQINEFKPKAYYGLQAITEKATFTWSDNAGQTRSFDKESIEKRLENLDGIHAGKIKDVKTSPKSQPAPHLFDLTELQKEAHKRWSWSAKETLSTLQNLYEHHKAVTYPRTDSKHLTSDMEGTLKERIKAVDFGPFRKTTNALLRSGTIKPQRGVIDDKRVSDHHAIIPTEETPIYQKLSDREQRLYELIVNRFLAVFFGAFRYDQVTAELVVGNETFNARGRTVTDEGWKKVYASDDDAVETLPSFKKGEEVKVRAVTMTEGKTTPPARFNEGTLLAAMENPTQFMQGESKDLIKTIGESGGLGTVATRADVIERLFKSFVIEKKGNDIFTTSKGRQLLELVPEDLKSPALTAEWEQGLTKIANGKMKKADFMKDMIAFSKQAVTEIKTDDKKFRHDNVTGRTCPDCGKLLLEVNGKRGKMHVCQDRECGYRRSISRQTNARCPVCKKRLELRGEGDGQIFVCSCGHREKLSVFEKRRKESGGKRANKKDVQNYMKKQEEPENTAMAEALKKLFDK